MPARELIDHYTPGLNEAPVRDQVEDLRWAEALVFLFPTWWYGMPAILKGYLDRVWLPGVAFHLPADGGRIQPGLTNIRKLAAVTTHGSPWWFMKFWMLEPNKAVLFRGLKPLLAPGCRTAWLAHGSMDKSTPESRRRFLAQGREDVFRLLIRRLMLLDLGRYRKDRHETSSPQTACH